MKRDITKSIEEYNKKFGGNTGNGAFYATDLTQIKETAEGETRGDREFVLISNALRAGFMIGYRKGQSDAKKREAARRESSQLRSRSLQP